MEGPRGEIIALSRPNGRHPITDLVAMIVSGVRKLSDCAYGFVIKYSSDPSRIFIQQA
jgi:hypothetical protein